MAACLLGCVRIDESISSSMVSCRCQLAGTCGLPSRGGSRSRPRCFPATTDRGWGRPWLPCLLFRSVQVTAIVSATPPKHGDFLLGETNSEVSIHSNSIGTLGRRWSGTSRSHPAKCGVCYQQASPSPRRARDPCQIAR